MLYVVELNFVNGMKDAERFMPFYAEHMRDLRTTPGLTTAQRFHSLFPVASPFMQVYTITDASVMQSRAYKSVGGPGHPIVDDHARSLTDWYRNVFDGMEKMPEVPLDSHLVVVDGRENAAGLPALPFTWLKSVALDRSVDERGMAIVADIEPLKSLVGPKVRIFRPMGPQF
jgi:hypothetical protein